MNKNLNEGIDEEPVAKRQRGSEDAEEDGDIEEATTQREEGEPPIEVPETEKELSEAQPSKWLKAPDEPTPAQEKNIAGPISHFGYGVTFVCELVGKRAPTRETRTKMADTECRN